MSNIHKLRNLNKVVASWSGGIDSTAVIGNLLIRGYHVIAVSLNMHKPGGFFDQREKHARARLRTSFREMQALHPDAQIEFFEDNASKWIWAFSPDGKEIPRRNKHIMDYLIMNHMIPRGIYNIAMGEYVGADTWVVKDHVAGSDADHRALEAYLYNEYGMDYRLLSLRDFGESRFKHHRLQLGWNAIGANMRHTTNCLHDTLGYLQCGKCYKCLERSAAFELLDIKDETIYLDDPVNHPARIKYIHQMRGEPSSGTFKEMEELGQKPEDEKGPLWYYQDDDEDAIPDKEFGDQNTAEDQQGDEEE